MQWIWGHVGHTYNEKSDTLAKLATTRFVDVDLSQFVDVEVQTMGRQDKKQLHGRALLKWQERCSNSETGRLIYESFPRVGTRRDVYVNQCLTGHGTFGDHHARSFQKNPTCFSGTGESTISYSLYVCALWRSTREKFFPREFQTRTSRDLYLDGYTRK